ncbi:MAG: proton-conducting transporter membrane subunit [Planctomycetaceae bacterium]
MDYESVYQALGRLVIWCPALLVAMMALTSLSQKEMSERWISRIAQTLSAFGLMAALGILGLMLTHGERSVTMTPWQWVSVGGIHNEKSPSHSDSSPQPANGLPHSTAETTSSAPIPEVPGDHSKEARLESQPLVSEEVESLAIKGDPVTEGELMTESEGPAVGEPPIDSAAVNNVQVESGAVATLVTEDPVDVAVHSHPHFHFEVKFVFDRLSVPFVLLTFILCATIGAFARSYMHHEPGYRRFFVLFSVFQLGMITSALAGSIETLFAGWELVGISSALLVAFYQNRSGPVQNGLRVWGVYRFADAAFLLAAISLHKLTGEGDFAGLMGQNAWPGGVASMTSQQALFIGSLLLIAAAGKSALVPFSGWLPRAMEGPTPSSAIFYGALSVHLGAYLLLRISPILELSTTLSVIVIVLGLSTAAFGTLIGRVQTDIKSSLSFASLTQVGLIVAEIGFGLRYLALIHLLGHACLRTLQLVRAPSLLLDYRRIEDAVGKNAGTRQAADGAPRGLLWYRLGMERGFLDYALDRLLIHPFAVTFRTFDRWERNWTDWLKGTPTSQGLATPTLPVSAEQKTEEVAS